MTIDYDKYDQWQVCNATRDIRIKAEKAIKESEAESKTAEAMYQKGMARSMNLASLSEQAKDLRKYMEGEGYEEASINATIKYNQKQTLKDMGIVICDSTGKPVED